jgi:hypothetical protein
MKKTLALLLAVAFAVPAFAGNILSNVETYGEIETIGLMTSSKETNGIKSVANRTLFGMSADLVEDVRANLTFAYNNAWEDTEGDDVHTYLYDIEVAEANVVVSNIFGALEAKIGRQFYGNEDSPVMYLGPRHNLYANIRDLESVDGALLSYSGESFAMSALYAQLGDVNGDYTGEHARMTGLTFDYAFNNNLTAGVYWYDTLDQDDSEDHLGIWGGKVAYQNEEAKLAVEYAKNYIGHVFGHNNEGWMLKADAAMNLDMEKIALTPRITYYHEEKDFIENGNYTPGIILGNMKVNVPFAFDYRILNAGIDFGFKALEKVTFSFDYLNAKIENHWLGNEYDLTAKYQHNDYVTFTLGGGVIANMTETPDAYAAQIGMLIKF